MSVLGDAVVHIGADTTGFRTEAKAGVAKGLRGIDGKKDGSRVGKEFGLGFNKSAGKEISSFGQLSFSFTKIAAGAGVLLNAITPIGSGLVGIAAGAVEVTGAVGLASGAMLSAGSAASSLGLAAGVAKIGLMGLTDTVKLQIKAQDELAATGAVSKTTAAQLAVEMAKLAPSARASAVELGKLGPTLAGFRRGIQQNLFAGMAGSLSSLATKVLPVLYGGFLKTATILNTAAHGVVAFVTSAQGISLIDTLLTGLNNSLTLILPAIGNIIVGLATLWGASMGPAQSMSQSFLEISQRFSAWATGISASGQFVTFLNSAKTAAGAVLGVVAQVGLVFKNVFSAGAAGGVSLLQSFHGVLVNFNALLTSAQGQTALASFFSTTGQTAKVFGDLLAAFGPLLSAVFNDFMALQGPLNGLRAAFLPIVTLMAGQLATILNSLAPAFGSLVSVAASFISILSPIAPIIVPLGTAIGIVVLAVKAWKAAELALMAIQAGRAAAIAAETSATFASGGASALATVAYWAQSAAMAAASVATTAWAGAMYLLDAAMTANPIGVVIVAIAALVGGLVLAYKKSETFRTIVNGALHAVGAAAKWLWENAFRPALQAIAMQLGWLMKVWAKVLNALGHVPKFGWAKTAGAAMDNAANKAIHFATSVKSIPTSHNTKVTANTGAAEAGVNRLKVNLANMASIGTAAIGIVNAAVAATQRAKAYAATVGTAEGRPKNTGLAGLPAIPKPTTPKIPTFSAPAGIGGGGSGGGGSKAKKQNPFASKPFLKWAGKDIVKQLAAGVTSSDAMSTITDSINTMVDTMGTRINDAVKAHRITKKVGKNLKAELAAITGQLAGAKQMAAAYEAAAQAVTDLKQARDDLAHSISDSLSGGFNLTDLFSGDNAAPVSFEAVSSYANNFLSSMKAFLGKIKQVGFLPPAFLQQIVGLGPSQGGQVIDAILSGSDAQRAGLSDTFNQIFGTMDLNGQISGGILDDIGKTVAGQMYDAGVAAKQAYLDGLTTVDQTLIDKLTAFAESITATLESQLKVTVAGDGGGGKPKKPKKPKHHHAGGGWWSGGWGMVGERGPELVKLPQGSRVYSNAQSERMQPAGASSNVVLNQNYFGPSTSNGRKREIEWTLRFATGARANSTPGVAQ